MLKGPCATPLKIVLTFFCLFLEAAAAIFASVVPIYVDCLVPIYVGNPPGTKTTRWPLPGTAYI
jgi:hypothetical protein